MDLEPTKFIVVSAGRRTSVSVCPVTSEVDQSAIGHFDFTREEFTDRDVVEAEFFCEFAAKRRLGGLSKFNLSSGEFPFSAFGLVFLASASEDLPIAVQNRADNPKCFTHIDRLGHRDRSLPRRAPIFRLHYRLAPDLASNLPVFAIGAIRVGGREGQLNDPQDFQCQGHRRRLPIASAKTGLSAPSKGLCRTH